jgi:anti-sigma regulatory factor (Ser/Thr protein kinase)
MSTDQTALTALRPQAGAAWEWLSWAVDTIGPPDTARPLALAPASWDRTGPARCFALALRSLPQAAWVARNFTRKSLSGWATDDRVEDVAVVASELATNAVRYGAGQAGDPGWGNAGDPGWEKARQLPSIWLGVWDDQWSCVVCGVADAEPDAPRLVHPDPTSDSGRGLHIVSGLSDGWGWTPRPGGGKVVWAGFGIGPAHEGGLAAAVEDGYGEMCG